jgi:hypothetical protein
LPYKRQNRIARLGNADIPECDFPSNLSGKSARRQMYNLPFRGVFVGKCAGQESGACRDDGGLRDMSYRIEHGFLYFISWSQFFALARCLRSFPVSGTRYADVQFLP